MPTIELLVSVRNAKEAQAAVVGGADIVDVKDPNQGSLGFAGWNVIRDVCSIVQNESPIASAALGELDEWTARLRAVDVASLPDLAYAKIGLANQADNGNADWEHNWLQIRKQLVTVRQWVAVAYSDFLQCKAPPPKQILEAAIRSRCRILLLDTYVKDGRTTFDHLAVEELLELIRNSQDAGLKVAIAGQVSIDDVSVIADLQPDIVAVRGAVCQNRDRRLSVEKTEVARLKEAIDSL